MLAVEQPFPPADYSAMWTWLGVAAVIAAIAAVVWAYLPRRQRKVVVAPLPPPAALDLDGIKAKYLAMVDGLDARHRDRQLTDRALHHQLSMVLRQFVHEAGGPQATNMTPADLRATGLPNVAVTVDRYWEPQFSPSATATSIAQPSAERAREVIRGW